MWESRARSLSTLAQHAGGEPEHAGAEEGLPGWISFVWLRVQAFDATATLACRTRHDAQLKYLISRVQS